MLLKAIDSFTDEYGHEIKAGSVWMKTGPCDFIPKTEVLVIETRKSFPLDKNEGIYIRNKQTGEVSLMKGQEPSKGEKGKQVE